MKRRNHIVFKAQTGKKGIRSVWMLSVLGLWVALTAATPCSAVSAGKLKSMPQFVRLVQTIVLVNQSMRAAAENPMDKWRRQNVQHAVGLMPAALRGLGDVFKAGALHDADLPIVQSMLGGFVDVNAPLAYEKFMHNPSANLIPAVGKNFPGQLGNGGKDKGGDLILRENQGGIPGNSTVIDPSEASTMPRRSEQIVDLSRVPNEVSDLVPSKRQGSSNDAGGGDIVLKEPLQGSNVNVTGAGSLSTPGSTSLNEAARDLLSIETGFENAKVIPTVKGSKKEMDEGFWQEKSQATPPTKRKARPFGKVSEVENSRDSFFASGLGFLPLLQIARFGWALEARADGESCQGCAKGGGEGSGSGGGGADFLYGLAAMMAAAAPMVAAAIQADADRDIADTNAKAAIKAQEAQSKTTLKLADNQKEIAIFQANKTEAMATAAQQSISDRQDKQLKALETNAERSKALIEDERAYQRKLAEQQLALKESQIAQADKLQKAKARAEATAAGFSNGIASTVDSASSLKASASVVGKTSANGGFSGFGSIAQGQTAASVPSGNSAKLSSFGVANQQTASATGATSGATGGPFSAAGAKAVAAGRGVAANRLLSNLDGTDQEEIDAEEEALIKAGKLSAKSKLTAKAGVNGIRRSITGRGIASKGSASSTVLTEVPSIGRELRGVMASNSFVKGSSPETALKEVREEAPVARSTDLNRFIRRTTGTTTERFSEYVDQSMRNAQPVTPISGGHQLVPVVNSGRGVYRAPEGISNSGRAVVRRGALGYSGE